MFYVKTGLLLVARGWEKVCVCVVSVTTRGSTRPSLWEQNCVHPVQVVAHAAWLVNRHKPSALWPRLNSHCWHSTTIIQSRASCSGPGWRTPRGYESSFYQRWEGWHCLVGSLAPLGQDTTPRPYSGVCPCCSTNVSHKVRPHKCSLRSLVSQASSVAYTLGLAYLSFKSVIVFKWKVERIQ